jgi:hypothetical protein
MPSNPWNSGISPHGAASHVNSGVTAALYGSLASLQIDASGAITAGYNAWNATPTYPANQLVLGSNSRLYRAVISNAGNDPTTDGGTNWLRVSIPLLGTSAKFPVSDGNELVCVTLSGDATLASTGAITVVKSNSNVFPVAATVLGDLWYGSAANTLLALAGNITTTKKYLAQTGNGAVSAEPVWATIATADLPDLAGDVTGAPGANTVVKANGNTFPASMILGDLLYGSGASVISKLAGNITTTRKFLRQTGGGATSAAPVWDTIVTGDLPALAGDVSGAPGANTVDKIKNVACGATSWAATAGRVPIFDGDSLESVAVTGDVTISSAGVTAIGAAKVTLAMLADAPLICVDLYGGLTPSSAAVDTYEWTAPYGPAGETFTFTTTRVTIRTNDDPSSGTYTVNAQKSTAAGAFSSAGNLLSSNLSITSGSYEVSSTSTGSSTFQSGNKLRLNWSAVGVGIGATSVTVEAKRTT